MLRLLIIYIFILGGFILKHLIVLQHIIRIEKYEWIKLNNIDFEIIYKKENFIKYQVNEMILLTWLFIIWIQFYKLLILKNLFQTS